MKYLLVMLGVLSSAPTWAQSSVQVRAILCEEIARVQGNGSPVYTNGLVEDGLPRPQAEAFGQTWMETVRSQCARPFAGDEFLEVVELAWQHGCRRFETASSDPRHRQACADSRERYFEYLAGMRDGAEKALTLPRSADCSAGVDNADRATPASSRPSAGPASTRSSQAQAE